MLLSEEEARAYEGMRTIVYIKSKKIRELNDGETEIWIKDFDLNLLATGSASDAKFENGAEIVEPAGAQIRISLEKEKIVCDGKESHNKIISWMSCDKEHLYELEQDTKPKKQVIL